MGAYSMNTTAFTQQVKAMSDRLVNLYQGIDTSSSLPLSALSELGIASERLQLAAKMLYQQNQQLSLADQTVEAERQRYQELLEFIPDACLLTDAAGRIQEANRAAAKLLNRQQSFLIGRSLTALLTHETRQHFQTQLQRLQQRPGKQEWQVRLQPAQGVAFDVSVLVEVNRQEANQPLTLRWLLRHASDCNQVEAQKQPDSNTDLGYPLQVYHKGETIPLNPETIWQVHSGLVKLTTFSDSGQEVLVGLAGAKAPFGSSLTALPLYQATALADTQLWCIPLTDFATSPELKQQLLPQISQRLRQTELLLAVYGQPRVADRLHNLLQLLKQEIGQPVADGTRLLVRLTHEDLATACCTTRVTITRLLKKLQQQKKLRVDSKHHLILNNL
ncbi:transcriptional regulator [Kalymmatonema gypsitolerans NIES-4073]|nr:transcriptional regulator [Scytonema sp. NIES-4073]